MPCSLSNKYSHGSISSSMKCAMAKTEAFLRLSAVLILVLTACLVALDTQTKYLIFVYRKATFRDLNVLLVLVYVVSVAAAYNLLQLGKFSMSAWSNKNLKPSTYFIWLYFLLDQIAVYVTFGANSAALQASLLAITGAEDFQWMKLCNKFTRFCFQMGGALACGYVACILMALVSSISAFNLFRLYSPKQFLLLKS